jgi:hypothetical protein
MSFHRRTLIRTDCSRLKRNIFRFSDEQWKELQNEYRLILVDDFHEITYQLETFLQQQRHSFIKLQQLLPEHRHEQS